jgi:hypothetical protein
MKTNRRRAALAALLLLASSAAVGAAERAPQRWYTYSIAGQTVGSYSEAVRSEPAGVVTASKLVAKLNRLGSSIDMRFAWTTREAASGELQSISYEALLSSQPSRLEAFVDGKHIRVLNYSSPDAPPLERRIDHGSEPLLGPEAVRRLTLDRLRAKGDTLEYSLFSPELQKTTHARRVVVAVDDPAPCGGRAAMKIEETIESAPGPRTLWIDADADLVQDSIDGPFGAMADCLATEQQAAATAAGGTLPDEIFERTLIRANVRLADADSVDRTILRLHPRDAAALPDFARFNQRVIERRGDVVLEVRRPEPPVDRTRLTQIDPRDEYLAPNAIVESSNAEIVSIANEAAGKEKDAYQAALAMTRWVSSNVKMDAGIVMAPASELVHTRRGTCMGFATLLASVARAARIPSRIVMGYVYFAGIWGGHAWVEMRFGDEWLPFDAAVYGPGVASATRLAAGASSFRDGAGDVVNAFSRLASRADITILEYASGSRVTHVAPDQPLYVVDGETYRNPGVGLRIRTAGYSIEGADSVWPSPRLVGFRGDGAKIEIRQLELYPAPSAAVAAARAIFSATNAKAATHAVRIGALDGWLGASDDRRKAAFAVADGATLWLYTAEAPAAEARLRSFLAGVERTN